MTHERNDSSSKVTLTHLNRKASTNRGMSSRRSHRGGSKAPLERLLRQLGITIPPSVLYRANIKLVLDYSVVLPAKTLYNLAL